MNVMKFNMLQSQVEIEHIFTTAYFDRITPFEVLQHGTSIKGGAHTYVLGKFMNTYHISTVHMKPTLNKSSALEHFGTTTCVVIAKH